MLTACGDDDEPDTNKKEEDKPENSAPMIADQTFSIAEDAAVDAEIGTVKATDAENDDLTFSITSGNTDDAFAMNASSGLLTVAKALDFETTMTYTLKVSVSDGTDPNTADITINVTDVEESPPPGTRLPDKDIDLAMENDDSSDLWSDGTTIWVADDDSPGKLYAYTLANGTRDATKEFDFVVVNGILGGIWSDRSTLWVAYEEEKSKLYAYMLADGTRDVAKEFDFAKDNTTPAGIWSDGTTIWVLQQGGLTKPKLYAYTLTTGARNADKEFDLEGNDFLKGLWSDGTTIWILDDGYDRDLDEYGDAKIYAYVLATGARDTAKEFNLEEQNEDPSDIWSDGTTLWVLDNGYDPDSDDFEDAKIYAYQLK